MDGLLQARKRRWTFAPESWANYATSILSAVLRWRMCDSTLQETLGQTLQIRDPIVIPRDPQTAPTRHLSDPLYPSPETYGLRVPIVILHDPFHIGSLSAVLFDPVFKFVRVSSLCHRLPPIMSYASQNVSFSGSSLNERNDSSRARNRLSQDNGPQDMLSLFAICYR